MAYNEREILEKARQDADIAASAKTEPAEAGLADAGTTVIPSKRETVGEMLRARRLEQGHEIPEISSTLRIKPQYLSALEDNRMSDLPGAAYVIGFIRSYAGFLGLDADSLVAEYKSASGAAPIRVHQPIEPDENTLIENPLVNSTHIILLIALVAVGMGIAYMFSSRGTNEAQDIYIAGHSVPVADPELYDDIVTADNTSVPSPDQPSERPVIVEPDGVTPHIPARLIPADSSPAHSAPELTPTLPSAQDAAPEQMRHPAVPITDEASVKYKTHGVPVNVLALIEETALSDESSATVQPARAPVEYGAKAGSRIQIRATDRVWIKLKRGGLFRYDPDAADGSRDSGTGETVFEVILEPGDSYNIPGLPGEFLTIGNASAIEIFVDGVAVPKIDARAIARHNIEMDAAKLKAGSAYVRNRQE